MRDSGVFIETLKKTKNPVTFIHGVYDPRPIEAVRRAMLFFEQVKLYAFENCGHTPWLEKDAMKKFFHTLKSECGHN